MTAIGDADYVPLTNFGRDHWSTLAYADTIIPDHRGFQVGFDGRMRQGRANFRVMHRDCPQPRRDRQVAAIVMDNRYSTVLRDGSVIEGHDDWHCVQDLVNAGLMGVLRGDFIVPLVEEVEPGVTLFLTKLGEEYVARIKHHKAMGGSFKTWTALDHAREAIPETTG